MKRKNIKLLKLEFIKAIILPLVFIILFCSFTYDMNILSQVKEILQNNYVDKLPDTVYNKSSIGEILKAINDPYTQYFTLPKYIQFIDNINNKHIGIGIDVDKDPNGAKVTSVSKGSSADSAGIKEGDIIVSANGENMAGMSLDTQMEFIKKAVESKAGLKVQRGNDYIQIILSQSLIQEAVVASKIMDDHIGYIAINSFASNTISSFEAAVNPLIANEKIDSFIIDLRYNGGGYLEQAIDLTGYFIGVNTALITSDRTHGKIRYMSGNHGAAMDKRVIFLINGFSASASEIMAAAVKDYRKAYLVGTTTYGKGCIQNTFHLDNGDFLKVTVQKFYSPKGNAINRIGVSPDLKAEGNMDCLRTAELLLNNTRPVTNTSGYVKLRLKNYGDVYISINKAISKENWSAYGNVIREASDENSVMIGTGNSWKRLQRSSKSELADLYYPNYKILPVITDADIRSEFRVKFAQKLQSNSLFNNVQLIEEDTGYIVPISTKIEKETILVATPLEDLHKNTTYYLVTYPMLKTAANKPLSYGTVCIIKSRNYDAKL